MVGRDAWTVAPVGEPARVGIVGCAFPDGAGRSGIAGGPLWIGAAAEGTATVGMAGGPLWIGAAAEGAARVGITGGVVSGGASARPRVEPGESAIPADGAESCLAAGSLPGAGRAVLSSATRGV
jgi:hypothetical protein